MTPTLFGREPALWLQTITAALALLVAVPGAGINDTFAALLISAIAAGFTAWQAFLVRPVAPTVFSAGIAAVAPLFAYFGLDFTQTQVGLFSAAVAAVIALWVRPQSTPRADPSGAVV
jgi:hypothetical protein